MGKEENFASEIINMSEVTEPILAMLALIKLAKLREKITIKVVKRANQKLPLTKLATNSAEVTPKVAAPVAAACCR